MGLLDRIKKLATNISGRGGTNVPQTVSTDLYNVEGQLGFPKPVQPLSSGPDTVEQHNDPLDAEFPELLKDLAQDRAKRDNALQTKGAEQHKDPLEAEFPELLKDLAQHRAQLDTASKGKGSSDGSTQDFNGSVVGGASGPDPQPKASPAPTKLQPNAQSLLKEAEFYQKLNANLAKSPLMQRGTDLGRGFSRK